MRALTLTVRSARLAGVPAAELEHAYRAEAARLRAALARRIGDVGLAEELVQDAFVEALEHWPVDGVPANPGGWLATTAWRKAVDRLRRVSTGQQKLALLATTQAPAGPPGQHGPGQDDDLLSLVFACCHPALPRDSQVALTLRTVCSLSNAEIAAAYLVSEQAMAQRLARARTSLRDARAEVGIPDPDLLSDRLDAAFKPGRRARLVQQQQCQQAEHVGLTRHQLVQQSGQPQSLVGEVVPGRRLSRTG